MALLSATQGTPERLWAIVSIVAAHGGSMARSDLQHWLKPRPGGLSEEGRDDKDRGLVNQAVQAASGLGLVKSQQDQIELQIASLPTDIEGFADIVHSLLAGQPAGAPDGDLFDAFACAVVQTEKLGNRQWFSEWTSTQIADLLTSALAPRAVETDDQRFNSTRPPTWKRWLEFVGLTETLLPRTSLLSATVRLERAIAASDLPRGETLDADEFLAWVATAMPYLDNGKLFVAAANRMGFARSPILSRLLSAALRDLHEDKFIALERPRGDGQVSVRLSPDQFSEIHGFNAILLRKDSSDD